MKKIFLCLVLFLSGCKGFSPKSTACTELGSLTADRVYVYLCGLIPEFVPEQMNELKELDAIGKKLNIKFFVIPPRNRCAKFDNRLCWPQDNEKELMDTYHEILSSLKDQPIAGYIGFSNGGFFLNQLAQLVDLKKPIISIGAAAGIMKKDGPKNEVYLLIGKQDHWHYKPALEFYDQSKNTSVTVHLTEYEDGHIIPVDLFKKTLEKINHQNG